ncbi:MAG TPA: hypothetical protein VI643_02665 [Planctomycetota bacterium]|nr:hypothetical protein [Planctomycetota bacterium]
MTAKVGMLFAALLVAVFAVVAFWAATPDEAIERDPAGFKKGLETAPEAGPVPAPAPDPTHPEETSAPTSDPKKNTSPERTGAGKPGLIYKTKTIEMPLVPPLERPLPPGTRIAEPGEPTPPSDQDHPENPR